MTTTIRSLCFGTFAALTLLSCVASPARADHGHNHLGNISAMSGELAGHARNLSFLVRESRINFQERRELIVDAAQLELSARRLQSFARIGNISLVERELSTLRQTARHFGNHAYGVGLGFSRSMRSELAAIEQDISYIGRELAREVDHYGPRPVRPISRPGFSLGGKGFSIVLP
ncbi:hypothetical protein ETAA8_35150 [Anatilimnocola aggregata]|uniref:Uncharacterized protein n=1 Tax=Anatilimnocola aggregata TaxID=2528021 RepID=A0A517YDV9_9BACT|nr:hypothetical protein [Anatilimnocola aggregata]QDU28415.1 hypothetical protein ETAA8_35150 [Anatilimnocola aggregata]